MTELDKAQNWIVEIFGTVIFILAAINISSLMAGQPAYVDTTTSIIGVIVGSVLMGKKSIANALGNSLNLKK